MPPQTTARGRLGHGPTARHLQYRALWRDRVGRRRKGRMLEVRSEAVQPLENLAGRGAGGELGGEQAGQGRDAGDEDEHADESDTVKTRQIVRAAVHFD